MIEPVAADPDARELAIRREFVPGDGAAIVELHRRVYLQEFGVDEGFITGVRETLDLLAERNWPGGDGDAVWIVERRGEPGGSLMLSDEGEGEGRVRLFLLEPELRGRGLGRRLLAELVEFARSHGYERLTLFTFADLRSAAQLYRDAGFRVVGEDHSPRWGRERFNFQHYELPLHGVRHPKRA